MARNGVIQGRIKKLIVESLHLEGLSPEAIGDEDALFDEGLGLDSIDALELLVGLEKEFQIKMLHSLHKHSKKESPKQLKKLQDAAVQNKNIFESLMEVTKTCSLGQITSALSEVGGQYRRNM